MGINPTGSSVSQGTPTNQYNWNYSNPDKPGFSTELVGTVLNIQEVQAMKWKDSGPSDEPDFWDEQKTDPKMNIRMVFAMPDSSIKTWTFRPASRAAQEGKAKSVHMDLFALTGNTDMANLKGHTLRVSTVQPPEGFGYGKQNPRPWTVALADDAGHFTISGQLPPEFEDPYLTYAKLQEMQTNTQPIAAAAHQSASNAQVATAPVTAPTPTVMTASEASQSATLADEDIPF